MEPTKYMKALVETYYVVNYVMYREFQPCSNVHKELCAMYNRVHCIFCFSYRIWNVILNAGFTKQRYLQIFSISKSIKFNDIIIYLSDYPSIYLYQFITYHFSHSINETYEGDITPNKIELLQKVYKCTRDCTKNIFYSKHNLLIGCT